MRIAIFGTGSGSKKFLKSIDTEKLEIITYVDNNPQKIGQTKNGIAIVGPQDLLELEFEYIIIASEYTTEIIQQLLFLGIDLNKIIPFYLEGFLNQLKKDREHFIGNVKLKMPIKTEKQIIGLITKGYSGSNTYALYRNRPKYLEEKYDIELIAIENFDRNKTYDLLCSTSIFSKYDNEIINVQLWHGFPLKKIGLRTELFEKSYNSDIREKTDIITSYSETYNTLFNASFPNESSKYQITGMPRNDFLNTKNVKKIENFFGVNLEEKKIICYLPTYRKWVNDMSINGDRIWENIFGFKDYNLSDFINFLKTNKLFFICKLHQMEANKLDTSCYEPFKENIAFIQENDLVNKDIDLYELLANIHVLITDYSSVYFDILLREEIGIVFCPTDLKSYKENRGFNLEPYEFWTPGPKVFNQVEMQNEIIKSLQPNYYLNERNMIKSIVHKYNDFNSTERVWKLIDKVLTNKNLHI